MADALWTLSVCATVLAWMGYVPEFRRLWRERAASGAAEAHAVEQMKKARAPGRRVWVSVLWELEPKP